MEQLFTGNREHQAHGQVRLINYLYQGIVHLSSAFKASDPSDLSQSETDQPSVDLDQSFFDAAKLKAEGKYEEARAAYAQELKSVDNSTQKRIVLGQLAECYKLLGREDYIDFLNTNVQPQISQDDDLYAATLELENLFLIPAHNYQKAIENLNILKTRFGKNGVIERNTLFNLGYIHTELLSDAAKGKEYYDELKTKFPDDMLTRETQLLLGEIENVPIKESKKDSTSITRKPTIAALLENYPNPFNPSTLINYQLPEQGRVSIKVYDLLGREVANLVDGMKETGYYSVTFDGSKLSSGIYFIRMTIQPQEGAAVVQVRKMVLTK